MMGSCNTNMVVGRDYAVDLSGLHYVVHYKPNAKIIIWTSKPREMKS